MTSSRVTSPKEEEGADWDGAERDGAKREGGATESDYLAMFNGRKRKNEQKNGVRSS